jgi:integral membrane sensor domain MASE1
MSSVVLFFIVAALIGGILNAFVTSAWMYLFMKMDHEGVGSKILHWFKVKKN